MGVGCVFSYFSGELKQIESATYRHTHERTAVQH
jgi:hypothetical protein